MIGFYCIICGLCCTVPILQRRPVKTHLSPKVYTQRHPEGTFQTHAHLQNSHRTNLVFHRFPPFTCRRLSDFHWILMFRWILVYNLQFSLHGAHRTERACQKTCIFPKTHTGVISFSISFPHSFLPFFREGLPTKPIPKTLTETILVVISFPHLIVVDILIFFGFRSSVGC